MPRKPATRNAAAPDPTEDRIRRLHEALRDAREMEKALNKAVADWKEASVRVSSMSTTLMRQATQGFDKLNSHIAGQIATAQAEFDVKTEAYLASIHDDLVNMATEAHDAFAGQLGLSSAEEMMRKIAEITADLVMEAMHQDVKDRAGTLLVALAEKRAPAAKKGRR